MESSKYADAVQLAVSPVDVRLVFTTSEPIIDNNTGEITGSERTDVSRIAMSLQLAKRFNKIHEEALSNYEAQNGIIPEVGNNVPAANDEA